MEGEHEENEPRGEKRAQDVHLGMVWLKKLRSGIPKLKNRVMDYDVIKPS